ncbi:Nucleoside phosphorylase domain containing protein [Elaphomyces granulatus]
MSDKLDSAHTYNMHPAPFPPRDRRDFEIAIICALPLEASVVGACFDKQWDDQIYGKAPSDSNAYSTGMIGHHNVVLVHMPNMGKVAAATAAACLCASFQGIQLALVVGICGAVPFGKQQGEDILLGDVVISEGLIQYDLGRQLPSNRFVRKDTPRDNLPRPGPKMRVALAKLQTEQGRSWLQNKTSENLGIFRDPLIT